jgi:hypothetical protein
MSGPWLGVNGIWVGVNSGYQRGALSYRFRFPGFAHYSQAGVVQVAFVRTQAL